MGRNSSPDYSLINVPYTDYTSHLCYTPSIIVATRKLKPVDQRLQ